MRTTPFYEVAEIISDDMQDTWGICIRLMNYDDKLSYPHFEKYFTELFSPSQKEWVKYNHEMAWWMSSKNNTIEENNEFRILALLLCHEIYLSENP